MPNNYNRDRHLRGEDKKRDNKKYPRESAGREMISNVPLCGPSDTVSEIREKIFSRASELETINYVYVLDRERLVGIFSLKEIFKREGGKVVESFMDKNIIKIRPYADREKAAILAVRHNLKAIPVTGEEDRFLGVIPSDVILKILHKEHVEDLFLSAGIQEGFSAKIIDAPIRILAKIRMPWLIVGLLGGVLAAQIARFFEEPLKTHFILAAFIPLIVYMADAVGAQTQTIYIRSLAINRFSQKEYFLKEIKVGILMGLVLSLLIFLISLIISGDALISTILSLSLFLTVLMAIVISMAIVQILSKMGKDPALGSGPFGTIIADISSLLIYFAIASFLLDLFGHLT